jgi:Flp pilus assembly protein TadG
MLARCANLLKSFVGDDRGAAFVEFTITFPILVVLALGAAEIGRAVQHHHVVEKSARDAARFLARVDTTCSNIVNAGDVTRAKNLAWTGYATGGTPILPYWDDPQSNTTVTVSVDCYPNDTGTILNRVNGPSGSAIPLITVSIAVPYQDIGFLSLFGISPFTLRGSHSEVSIGE